MLWAKNIFYFAINQHVAKSFGHEIIWSGITLSSNFALYRVSHILQLYFLNDIIIATIGNATQFLDSSLITSLYVAERDPILSAAFF